MIEYLIYCKSWKVEEVYTQDYGAVSRMAGAVRRGEAVAKYEGFGAEWWEYWVPSMELAESVVYANREKIRKYRDLSEKAKRCARSLQNADEEKRANVLTKLTVN